MLQKRKNNRLQGFDYSNNYYYFITIDIISGYLGNITPEGNIILNRYGSIVHHCWVNLFKRNHLIEQDEFIIMPDHLHAIVILNNTINSSISLSKIICSFKSDASRKIHSSGLKDFTWQRSFFDRIIRNEKELNNIRNYIKYNPLKLLGRSNLDFQV